MTAEEYIQAYHRFAELAQRLFGEAQRLHVHFYLNDLHGADFANAVAATQSLIDRLLPLSA